MSIKRPIWRSHKTEPSRTFARRTPPPCLRSPAALVVAGMLMFGGIAASAPQEASKAASPSKPPASPSPSAPGSPPPGAKPPTSETPKSLDDLLVFHDRRHPTTVSQALMTQRRGNRRSGSSDRWKAQRLMTS